MTGLLENLLTISPAGALPLLSPKSSLLKFLLARIGADKLPADRNQNRFYAGELLAILLGTPIDGIAEGRKRIASEGAVDSLLKVIAVSSFHQSLAKCLLTIMPGLPST